MLIGAYVDYLEGATEGRIEASGRFRNRRRSS